MTAWITFGPIIDDARLDKPKSPKNWYVRQEVYKDSYTG